MNKEEALNNLISSINELPEVKRIHTLEKSINDNNEINDLFEEMHKVEKKLVNARYYKLDNAARMYEEELLAIKNRMSDIPFLDEYIELLEEVHQMLNNIGLIIESNLNNHMK